MTEMQHSNSKLDNTHPKVDIWRNMESPGLNCVQNSSGFLVCVLIYTYMYMHLWSFGMSICRGTSQSKGEIFVLQLPHCITANLTAKGTPVKGTPPGAHFRYKWPRDEKNLLVGSHGVSVSRWDWVVHGVISQSHFCALEIFFSTELFSRKPACNDS